VKAEGPKRSARTGDGLEGLRAARRFGHYVQLGETPPRVKGSARDAEARVDTASISASAITLAEASTPQPPRDLGRPVGRRDHRGVERRFGPYVKHGDEFRSSKTATTCTRSRWSGRWRCSRPKKSRRRTMTRAAAHPRAHPGRAEVTLMDGATAVRHGRTRTRRLPKRRTRGTDTRAGGRLLKARRAGRRSGALAGHGGTARSAPVRVAD